MIEIKIQGRAIEPGPSDSGVTSTGKEWKKTSILIETIEQYPKQILLQNFRNPDNFARIPNGTVCDFYVNIESRKWHSSSTGKSLWFTDVTCWKWDIVTAALPKDLQPHPKTVPRAQIVDAKTEMPPPRPEQYSAMDTCNHSQEGTPQQLSPAPPPREDTEILPF